MNKDGSNPEIIFNRLNNSIGMFVMHFESSKYQVLWRDWIGSKPKLVPAGKSWKKLYLT